MQWENFAKALVSPKRVYRLKEYRAIEFLLYIGQQVLRAVIADVSGIANIIMDITDIAMDISDIVTDIADIATDIADIVNIVDIAVEIGRRV